MRLRAIVCAFFIAAAAFAQSPPIARLISVTGEDDATITGAAGAVAPNADVLCETMETGHYTIVRAAADGSFTATLFAPPGTSILVKSDAARTQLQQIVALPPLIDFHLNQSISLPGTIVRRDDPPGDAGEIGFGSALVVVDGSSYSPVTVRGSLNGSAFKAGDDLKVRVTVTAHGAALKGTEPKFQINLALTPLAGPDGSARLAQDSFCSTFMTPAGLPIERQQWLYTYDQAFTTARPAVAGADATAELHATLPIRADLPAGYYRPAINFRLDVTPQGTLQNARITTFIDTTRRGGVSIYLPVIVAHGRRGIDDQQVNRQAWFFRTQTGETFGRGHVQIPFHSGDVMWMEDGDAAVPNVSFHDPQGTIPQILNSYCCGPRGDDAAGETPPFSGNLQGRLDVHLSPGEPDIVGYSYGAVERPLVRVREIIGEQGVTAPYWRFNDLYGLQSGTGPHGDLPNDFKFQFAGVVLRGGAIGEPLYAIYGSLFVLVPTPDAGGGTRIFPPFQGNGGGPSGGPLFTLKGKPVDIFFHPTAVRPGTILVQGETASFAGYSAPALPSKISIDVTSPGGRKRSIKGQANKIGWFYDPGFDLAVDEPGVWKVRVTIAFDGATSAGQVGAPFPTAEQTFNFYVVRGDAAPLGASVIPSRVDGEGSPSPVRGGSLATLGMTREFTVTPPPDLQDLQLTYTTMMPGFVLEEGTPSALMYIYDAQRLAADFPNLEPGVDAITISLLLSGTDATGKRQHFARAIVIQGEELQMPEQKAAPTPPRRRSVR